MSAPTGGRAFFTDSIDELHGAFDELLDELSNQYLLGYPPPGDTRDDRWHRIKVDVDGHPQVRARQGYRVAKERTGPERSRSSGNDDARDRGPRPGRSPRRPRARSSRRSRRASRRRSR